MERLAFSFFLFGDGSRRRPDHFFAFLRHKVRARKPSSLALRAGEREPNRSPGHFFRSFRCPGLRTKTEFIGFAGSRTQPLQAPGPPFLLFPVPRFAYENRIHWLCGQSYATPAGARATFSALSGAPVCVRKPNSLALRAVVRKPCRRPGHLFCSFRCPGLRTKTESIGFAGTRTQTLQAPGPPFLLFPVPRFAYENRIHWLCGQSYANPAGTLATFSALSGAPVCVRKPNSLTLRALVRKPCRRPDHLFCSLVDRNRCKGLSNICRKMCRLGFQKIFCSYSDFASLCSRNSSECLFNSFS